MSKSNEPDPRERHISTPDPAVEADSGQYATGDYGDAGSVDARADARGSGEYAEGDYGDAGTAHQRGIAADQANGSPGDQDAGPARPDDDSESGAHRE
ncbi:hypothetical protein [Arthrobacter sp. ZGTC412]|uniref:hypothetical protein n=1 Tax=Arthrobacter sp. ZGTC412 TaxID=2058900 RepID=UPI000CE3B559|nr:hypothetical protein [Arthrobacter sp. ZGTC412]